MSAEKVYKNFKLEVKDGIAIFTIDRPASRNALSGECYEELYDFIQYAESNDEIRVIIITGAGEKAFISGADVNDFSGDTKITAAYSITPRTSDAVNNKLEGGIKPVIAAVNGYAFGGGFELAMSCDIRIVSENAQFGLPETKLGIIPGWGGTQRLSRLVGIGRAKEVILGGRVFKGQECVDVGLAMKCVPLDQLMDEALKLAEEIKSRAPLAIAFAKRLVNQSATTDMNTGMFMETMGLHILLDSEDRIEGTDAFFNKRKPNFKGK